MRNNKTKKSNHHIKGLSVSHESTLQCGSKEQQLAANAKSKPAASPSEAEIQRLCRELARQVPGLRATLLQIRTEADWKRNQDKIDEGIVDCTLDEIERYQVSRRIFSLPDDQNFARVTAALQKVKRRIRSAART